MGPAVPVVEISGVPRVDTGIGTVRLSVLLGVVVRLPELLPVLLIGVSLLVGVVRLVGLLRGLRVGLVPLLLILVRDSVARYADLPGNLQRAKRTPDPGTASSPPKITG